MSQLPKLGENQFYYHEIIDYRAVDETHGEIGSIKFVNDQTMQALFFIDFNGKEIIIPVNDRFIQKVDKEEKTIYFKTPEGLIDMYLED